MNEKKPRGYVVAFQERRTAYRALIKDEQAEVVQRLLSAAPAVWHQVEPFRHWTEQLVAEGGFESDIFELKDVKGDFGFTSPRQLNRSLQALRDAWKGVVRVQLCQSSMGETWRLIRLRAI